MSSPETTVDLKALEWLIQRLEHDGKAMVAVRSGYLLSLAEHIGKAIGAPLMWPTREAGANEADTLFPGSPDMRYAFNWGVKWAVEHYSAEIKHD